MKKLLSFILLFISISSNAQHSFTAWVTSVSGSCNTLEDKVTVGIIQQTAAHRSSTNYPSYDICEDMRRNIMEGYSSGSCTVRVATTRCTPSKGAGAVDISGPSQGYSFYSSNPADEVYNWSSDDIERHLAFDQNYQVNMPKAIKTNDDSFNRERALARENGNWYLDTDKPFVSVNMREGGFSKTDSDDFSMKKKLDKATDFSFLANSANVQRYVKASKSLTEVYVANPQDLTQLLHDEFKAVSGFDLDAIMQKLPSERTKAEKQALLDYQEYRKQVLEQMIKEIECIIENSKEKKEINAAILANDVYRYKKDKKDYDSFIEDSGFKLQDLAKMPNHDPMKGVADAIMNCNQAGSSTGFHAEIYKNEITNTYVISVAGSDDPNDWLLNNGPNLLNGEVPQYILALAIANALNNIPDKEKANLNIEIVGHSLGGGVASIIGLATGLETMTFNAARVPESFLIDNNLNNLDASKITAYHTSTDLLTSLQQTAGTPAIGTPVNIGDPSTTTEKVVAEALGASVGYIAGSSVGTAGAVTGAVAGPYLGEMAEGHRMGPIVRNRKEVYNKEKKEWDRLHQIQSQLRKKASGLETQTQDSILIITDN